MGENDDQLNRYLAEDLDRSFERLMETYQRSLYNFVRYMLPHPQDTEDIVQEIFANAYRALRDWKQIEPEKILTVKLRPWLFRIARNLSLNHITRGGIHGYTIDTPTGQALCESTCGDQHPSPERIIEQQETYDELYFCIRALPYHLRISCVMHYISGMPYHEIATILDQPINTVKSNGRRSLEKLQKIMRERQHLNEE